MERTEENTLENALRHTMDLLRENHNLRKELKYVREVTKGCQCRCSHCRIILQIVDPEIDSGTKEKNVERVMQQIKTWAK